MKQYSTLFFLFLVFLCPAQNIPKHSFSLGLKSGAATVTYFELNTAHFGLALDHQRNFNSLLSLRTSLHYSYFLPSKLVEYVNYDEKPAQSVEVDRYYFQQLSLRLMPCLYHRD